MTRPTNINALRDAARKRKRKSLAENIAIGVVAAVIVLAVVAAVLVLSGAVTLFAWNVGVVGVAAALGAKVSTIGLWTAIGAFVTIGVLGRLFHTPSTTTVNNKA